MKKKIKEYSSSFEWITIYKDELEEIYKILIDNFSEVKIEINEDELDDIKELDEYHNLECLSTVKFIVDGFMIRIDIDSTDKAKINILDGSDPKLIGSAHMIEEILQRNHSKIYSLFNKISNSFIGMVVLAIFLLFINVMGFVKLYGIEYFNKQSDTFYLLATFISVGGGIYLTNLIDRVCKNKRCIIYTKTQKLLPTFFKRNRDAIIMNVIFFVLGVIVTNITSYIKG